MLAHSRRRFLKNAGLTSLALTSRPAWPNIIGANDRINVAVIGLGARGSEHQSLLLQHARTSPISRSWRCVTSIKSA
jgi:hypothetical protein